MEKIPSFFTYEYLRDNIIPIAESIDTNPLRNKALFYFMFFTGIRRSEINSLKRKDFDLENRKVKIIGHKGKKERIVIIHKKIVGYIETYFASFPEKSNAFNCKTISLYRILKNIQPYCKDIHLHPHCFRHSFAVHFLKQTKGQGIFALSKLLGHVSIETTMKYLKSINCDDIKKMFDEFM
jgi:integrase/recombinase XerC